MLAHILIAAIYAAASFLVAASAVRFGDADATGATALGMIIFLICALVQIWFVRGRATSQLTETIERLKADVQRAREETQNVRSKLEFVEASIDRQVTKRNEALVAEVRVIEDMLERITRNQTGPVAAIAAAPATGAPYREADNLMAVVRHALERNQVDLHLQPIVTLPQRRTAFYEGFTRIRDAAGRTLMPTEFLKAAEAAGLLTTIDNLLLFRCVQIVRKLAKTDKRIGVFCNVSPASLGDEGFFPQFLDFMRENKDLSGSLIFEITQESFDTRDGVQARNMGKLQDLGFRFSIDRATKLKVDLPAMQKAGVHFFKASGTLINQELGENSTRPASGITRDIEPRDVAALFARYGIDLIADRIEDERTVIEILDLDIGFGQGHLFGQPKPLKDSILEDFNAAPIQRAI
ncbi:MAG: EAL domain-containing protein [Caulobacterales bacterium]